MKRKQNTFIVEIKDTQSHSWQGRVVWVEEDRKQMFRSALELIKLLDSALESPE